MTIAMWPNPALAVWLVVKLLSWTGLLPVRLATITLRDIRSRCALVWSLYEAGPRGQPVPQGPRCGGARLPNCTPSLGLTSTGCLLVGFLAGWVQ